MNKIYKKLCLGVALVIGATPVYADTLLIKNVNGYTLDESGELVTFKALAVDDGKISALNPDTTVQYDRTVDGSGKTLLPGMIDAHGHLLGLGSNLLEVDLRDTDSVQQAVSKVAEYEGTRVWMYMMES